MYTPKEFSIPQLSGISQKNIEEHLALYTGYVKQTNMIIEKLQQLQLSDTLRSTLHRRLGFEFNGMRNHEYYFEQIEHHAVPLNPESLLSQKIVEQWGSIDDWKDDMKNLAYTRGVGWALLGYDHTKQFLIHYWVDEQHIGHLNDIKCVFAIDMWEHAFVSDYLPSGKKEYIDDYFNAVNWSIVEDRYHKLISSK